ncbi:MAG: CPBP family intramembrane glutamic endopeptidase [Acidobacteriota bacterium]
MDENQQHPPAPQIAPSIPQEPPPGAPESLALPPRRELPWLFVGRNGIRAGWSALAFYALFFVMAIAVSLVIKFALHPKNIPRGGAMSPWLGIANEAGQFLLVVAATWIMSRIERRPLLFYGFQGRARLVRFFSGLVCGFAAISGLVFVLAKLGYIAIEGRLLSGAAAWHYALLWGLVFLCVGFFEESFLRGYAQFTLTRGLGFWGGALILSFLFGFGHGSNPGESPVGLFAAGAVGLLFCLSLWYTGSLWWAVGFHAAWDWGESYFYGTADSGMQVRGHLFGSHPIGKLLWSGGSTGPEGSLLVLPLLLVIALLMAAWWEKRGEKPFKTMAWKPGRLP